VERGYVKLWRSIDQNELLENDNNAFIVFTKLLTRVNRFTGSYTTGRNKFAVVCNMRPTTLYGVLKRLESSSVLRLQGDRNSTTIFICNWHEYQQDADRNSNEARSEPVTIQEKKENIDTKVSIAKTPSKDINEMFDSWEQIVGYKIDSQAKANRYACSNLLKKHGRDGVLALIRGVAASLEDSFAPRISDFSSLQYKQNELVAWGKRKQITGMRKVAVI